ncbi:MAG: M20/M25/M40 family metallo-hydrolase [Bacteroidota bacterium]
MNMTRILTFIFFYLSVSGTLAQRIEKIITENDISRVLKTLSADGMMGRPAAEPARIEPAAKFLEQEFRSIGLQYLPGLNSYRQEFTKTRISPKSASVVVNGKLIPSTDVLVVSEKGTVAMSGGMKVATIKADTSVKNKMSYFYNKVRSLAADTTPTLVLVDPALRAQFDRLRGFFMERFASGQPGTSVLVIGPSSVEHYAVEITQEIAPVKMTNITGRIPGRSRREEMVVFSGHYDHIGIQQPVAGDSIANGADDDASGTTAVVALARYFKKIGAQERTLVFAAFTAEEIGGFGSQHFSRQLDPEQVVAMFNIEMIGKESKFGRNAAFITGFEKSDFGVILQRNLSGTPFTFHPDPYPEQDLFYRSDNATLARLGVPAHTISTDQIDIDKLYHSVDDEFESMNIGNVTATIRAIALSARGIVSGKDTPRRVNRQEIRGN